MQGRQATVDMDKKRVTTSLPIQTGRADLPHPAFRSVALTMDWLRRRTKGPEVVLSAAQACAPLTGFPAAHCPAPVSPQAALRRTDAHSLAALRRLFFIRSVSRMALLSYVPSLHGRYPLLRYYGRSDPDGLFGCRPPWFPDSRHSDFRPFCLQPSAVSCQTRSTSSTLAALFFFVRASPFARGLAETADRIEFTVDPCLEARRYGLVVHFQLLPTRGYRPGAVTFSYWPCSVGQVRDLHPAV